MQNRGLPAVTGYSDNSNGYQVFSNRFSSWRPTILSYNCYFISTLIGYPLDTIKTRMQTYSYKSYWTCVKKTYMKEGFLGFCHGVWTPVFSTAGIRSFNISIYSMVKPNIYHLLYQEPNQPNLPVCVLSGNIAGTLSALVSAPFEYCKIYNQIINLEINGKINNNFFHISKDIIKLQGIKGLYSGLHYHICRDFMGSAIYYSVYESFKSIFNNQFAGFEYGTKLSILFAGGLAGVSSWSLIFPIDTLKAKYQKNSVINIVRNKNHLPSKSIKLDFKLSKNLYRGLSLSITRTCLTSMVFFSLYEISMATLI